MAKRRSLEQLIHKTLDSLWIQGTTLAVLIHVLLEILLTKLEDKHQLRLGVYNIM